MRAEFQRSLETVTITHVLIVTAVLLLPAGCQSLFGKRTELTQPVEFMVQVPAGEEDAPAGPPEVAPVPPAPPPPAPEPDPAPEPAPPPPKPPPPEPGPSVKIEDKKPPPRTDAKKADAGKKSDKPRTDATAKKDSARGGKVDVSNVKVVRRKGMGGRSATSPLSETQIRQLLLQGAAIGDRTVIPGEDERNLALVQRALYSAWLQPAKDDAGDAVAEATIRFDATGRIVRYRLSRPSGRGMLDASVMAALKEVDRVQGLSSRFLNQRPDITIAFKVE